MSDERSRQAIARIERALARIEAAAARPRNATDDDGATQVREAHLALRGKVEGVIEQIDRLLAGERS